MKTEPTEAERAATVPETVALLGLHQPMASDCLDIIDGAVKRASERMEHQTPNELVRSANPGVPKFPQMEERSLPLSR
jgi:hypothetical protein